MPRDTSRMKYMQSLSHQQGLKTWAEVAAEWNRRSGENITKQRVWQICNQAEAKLREALAQEAESLGLRPD